MIIETWDFFAGLTFVYGLKITTDQLVARPLRYAVQDLETWAPLVLCSAGAAALMLLPALVRA